jgi:hypothetical protein
MRGGGAASAPPHPGVRGFADAGRWSIEVGGQPPAAVTIQHHVR